ncbi:ComEC/Rec2 family competence protein [Virgibacillus oceani]|uniref:Competence protein ComE n=1 Tax=Virgibacillus oceani TaxID=1479511 RepID=A0A917MA59_9BACI|nr:ComEC/Rec2 family competence protein [Virgibacillus oceani]GGG87486.1 competence protein ComE [Virgibacillus oceani]
MRNLKWTISIALLILIIYPANYSYSETDESMKVHFIDVGQGDSILIETPNDKTILIDGGPPKSGKLVVEFLKKHHVKNIDLLIATHPDIDHIGGLVAVMKSIDVDRIIDSGKLHTTNTFAKYIDQIIKNDIHVDVAKRDDIIDLDPLVKIRILNTHNGKKNNNQSSIVLKLSYGEIDFLLMGDSERKQEKRLIKTNEIQSEILKVGHHGSKTSTSLPFVDLIKPQIAILTYSKTNKYGHPVDRVIHNLQKVNAHIYSTAVFGNITITTDGKGYFVITEKDPMDGLIEKIG